MKEMCPTHTSTNESCNFSINGLRDVQYIISDFVCDEQFLSRGTVLFDINAELGLDTVGVCAIKMMEP